MKHLEQLIGISTMIEKKGYIIIAAIVGTMFLEFFIIYFNGYIDAHDLLMRLCGLYGYLGISISTMMTPFLKEISHTFGRTFVEVHHVTAAVGIGFITAHPFFDAIYNADPTTFVPVLDSWDDFWTNGGRVALLLIYVAFIAVLLRTKYTKYWRPIHALMYVVLFFGIIHANLIQSDFVQSPVLLAIYNGFFGAVMLTFVLKRWQRHQMKVKHTNAVESAPSSGN